MQFSRKMVMDAVTSKEQSYVMCNLCPKKFSYTQLLNRHKKRIHKIVSLPDSRESRILCPLCEERNQLKTHEVLRKHIQEKHAINVELLTLQFSSIQEYELWKSEGNINSDYAVHRTNRRNDHKEVNYTCNRSDYKGYLPNYQERTEKLGGTIRIQGMCPSKLICRMYDDGTVSISFWKTHVGHESELRTSHLSKTEKNSVINKLKSGISVDSILEDARNLKGAELQRVNLITRDEITYLSRKHNIDNKMVHNEVRMYEVRIGTNSILDNTSNALEGNSVIKSQNEKKIAQFIDEKHTQENREKLNDQDERGVRWSDFKKWVEALDNEVFNKFMNNIQGAIKETDQAKVQPTNKRKIETRKYFPIIKRQK